MNILCFEVESHLPVCQKNPIIYNRINYDLATLKRAVEWRLSEKLDV